MTPAVTRQQASLPPPALARILTRRDHPRMKIANYMLVVIWRRPVNAAREWLIRACLPQHPARRLPTRSRLCLGAESLG
jgi:hypothetical protein